MRRAHGLFFCSTICVVLAGCSSTFDRDWYSYLPTDTEDALVGRWDGFWKSYRTERQGDLRCMIVRRAEGRYVARFHATFRRWWTRSYEHTVHMVVERSGDTWKVKGSENLGWVAGGVHHYRGEFTRDTFKCFFSADEDRGVFELVRYSGDASSPP